MTDVAIIGAGVIGCAIARELSRYALSICILEKGADVAVGSSKANSGIVHAGYDALPGSNKAIYNARGSAKFPALVEELDVPYRRNGSLVVAFSEEDAPRLEALLTNGKANGIQGLSLIDGTAARALCPSLSPEVCAALYAETAAVVCPYELTAAFAENAVKNGASFRFNAEVSAIVRIDGGWRLTLAGGETLDARLIINAAGVHADELNNLVSARKLRIIPRKGEYCLFDKAVEGLAPLTIFQLPTAMGKGVLVTQTADGNLLVGPTATDITDKAEPETTREGLEYVLKTGALSVGPLPERQIITAFAGLRAHLESDDFEIGEAPDAEGFINVAGIESPGLSASPAIGEAVALLAAEKLGAVKKADFDPTRRGIPRFRELSNAERSRLIAVDPAYGRVVCRCETVTEAEIVEAIRRSPGAKTLDGVKRRTRAGMGRCQAGFCTPRMLELLERELDLPREKLTKSGGGSSLLTGKR